jgi:hypothetical protein
MKLHIKSNEKIDGKVKIYISNEGLRTLTLSTILAETNGFELFKEL